MDRSSSENLSDDTNSSADGSELNAPTTRQNEGFGSSDEEVQRLTREFESGMIQVHEDDDRRAKMQEYYEAEAKRFSGPQERISHSKSETPRSLHLKNASPIRSAVNLSLIVALLLGLIVYFVFYANPLPKDEELIGRLKNKNADFVQLVSMARGDGKPLVTITSTPEETGLSVERLERYKALLSSCQVVGVAGEHPDRIYLSVGFLHSPRNISGEEKGYLCARRLPEQFSLLNNLDNPYAGEHQLRLRQIDDQWFLYLQNYWREHRFGR